MSESQKNQNDANEPQDLQSLAKQIADSLPPLSEDEKDELRRLLWPHLR